MNKTLKKMTLRLLSFALIVCLSLEHSISAQAQMQSPLGPRPETLPAPARNLQPQDFPKDLGSITEVFQAKAEKKPLVILVQDAHAVPEAQRAMARLTAYFQKTAGLSWVGVEGSSEKLDPLLLGTFPDKKALEEVLDGYMSEGEISGAVTAAILGSRETTFAGLEDGKLYEEDINAFLESLQARSGFEKQLKELRAKLEELRSAWFSEDMAELEKRREAFERENGDLFEYLRAIAKLRPSLPADFSGTHPLLSSLLSMMRSESEASRRQLDLEIKALAGSLEKGITDFQGKSEYHREKQAYETEQKAPEEFLTYLLDLNGKSGNARPVPDALRRRASEYKRVQQAAGEDLSREISSAVRMIKNASLRSDLDRRLDAAGDTLELLEKAAALEMNAAEWARFQTLASRSLEPAKKDNQEQALEELEAGLTQTLKEMIKPGQPWIRFYEKAEAREEAMWERISQKVSERDFSLALLVAGGFHRAGLAEKLRKAGISYWVISPAISHLPEENKYSEQMQGEISWKKEFKVVDGRVSVYDAFHRAAFDRLLKAHEGNSGLERTAALMREWRENILRALAAEGHIEKASDYTRYLDQWNLERMDPRRRKSLTEAWAENVAGFVAALQKLHSQKQLTAESLSGLLARPAAIGWTAVKVLSHETIPAPWVQRVNQNAAANVPASVRESEERTREKVKTPLLTGKVTLPETQKTQPAEYPRKDKSLVQTASSGFWGASAEWARSELRIGTNEDLEWAAAVREALEKPQLKKLKIAVNLKDVGAFYRDGVLSYEDSLRKLKKLLPVLRSQGAGSVYVYGGLYDMGGISSRLHQGRPDKRAQYIPENDGKTLVKIEGYPTKKTQYDVPGTTSPLVVEDGHNPFSILSMQQFNPHLSSKGNDWGTEARTHEQLKDLIQSAHELGLKVTLDFIPWVAPDAINESNYRWTFYQELPDSENQRFRGLPDNGEGETKEAFLRKKIDENPSYFTVRIKEPGRDERVILVRHLVSDMGGFNVDQAVLNPFLPAVREYYRQSMQRLVDAGADEVRVDLGHVYLREYIADPGRGYFSDAYWNSLPSDLKAQLEESLRTIREPWEGILKDGKEYARGQKKELSYVMEAYDENHLKKLRELGADKTYYADVFKNLVRVARGEPAHFLEAALRHAVGNRGSLMAFPSNFDQFPLRSIKGAQNAAKALLLIMPELQLDVMWDLRDWMGFSGQIFPMVGGDQDAEKESDHTFASQKEFEITTNPEAFYEAVKNNKTAPLLAQMLRAIDSREERYIEFLDNARRDRYTTFAWQTEKPSDWRILVLNFKPQDSERVDFVDLPRRALIEAGAKGFKAVDAETGEALEINREFRLSRIPVSSEKQYRLIRIYREPEDQPFLAGDSLRSELRAEEPREEDPEKAQLRKTLFHDRILNEETKALLVGLLPKPLMEAMHVDIENTPWSTGENFTASPGQYVFRVSFQDPAVVVFSLAPAMPGPLGLSKEAAVYLPMQDLGEGYLGLLQHGRVQKLEISVPRNDEERKYKENPFQYWLENNLDEAAGKMGLKGTLLTPLMLNREQLAALGFKQTRDESLWYRKTGGEKNVRSELRATSVPSSGVVFGKGRALSEDYSIEGDYIKASDFSALVQKMTARIDVLSPRNPDAAAKARLVLEHLIRLKNEKRVSVFTEQRWGRDSYLTGSALPTDILMGQGFLAVPELAEETLFRLAEKSWLDLKGIKGEFGKLSEILYRSEDLYKADHQAFVELKDERVLRAAIQSFKAFSQGSRWQDTRALLEDWLKADIAAAKRGDEKPVFPVLEQAGYLAQAIVSHGWDKLPLNPANPDEILEADPVKAAAFFEVLYPLYIFAFHRYQFFSHANTLRNIFLRSIRKSVEQIDQQLRDKIKKTPDLMRAGKFAQLRVIDYLAETGFEFSNDVGVPEDLLQKAPVPLIEAYQKNVGKPDKIAEKNTAVIDAIAWGIFEKTVAQEKNEIHPQWHLYADIMLGVPPTSQAIKAQKEHYHKMVYAALRAPKSWQEEWFEERFKFEKAASDEPVKLSVPGRDTATTATLTEISKAASGYRWNGLLAQQNNVSEFDGDAQMGMIDETLSHKAGRLEILTVSGSPVSPFWQHGSRLHYHVIPGEEGAPDRLRVVREEVLFWSELLVWTSSATATAHYRDSELPLILPVIGAVRRNFLQREGSHGPFNFEGVNVKEWVRDILAIHDLAQIRFWELVESQYGQFSKFFDKDATPATEQRLLWYYSLFRHPKGLFAEMANRLETIPGSQRLTPESASFILDSLYAILWSGPERRSLIDGNRWLLGNILHFVHFHPDGVSIPDMEGFKHFLTRDLAEPGTELNEQDFTRWLEDSLEKYKKFPETDSLVEATEMKPPPADGPDAQMRAVIDSDTDYVFDPEKFPAKNLLRPEAHPWKGHSERYAVWQGTYQNGLSIPGSVFKYVFPADKVKDGTPLLVKVLPAGKDWLFEVWNEAADSDAPLVRIPLAEARKEKYGRGLEYGQFWERVPDFSKVLPAAEGSAFEEIEMQESGFLLLSHQGQEAALHFPSLHGDASRRIRIHRTDAAVTFYTLEGNYLGEVTFGRQPGRQAFSSSDKIKVFAPIPVPLEAPKSASLSEYTNLLALTAGLQPLMATGRGYDKLVVTERMEGEAGLENRAFVLPRRMLDDVPAAIEKIRSLLESQDPAYKLRLMVGSIDTAERNGSYFDSDYQFPSLPGLEPLDSRWTEMTYQQYRELHARALDQLRVMKALRKLDKFRASHEEELGTHWSKPGIFRRVAAQLLENTETKFQFNAKGVEFKSLKGLTEMEDQQRDSALRRRHTYTPLFGIGVATAEHFRIFGGELTLSKNPNPDPATYFFIRTIKGEQASVQIFDMQTGDRIDEKERIFRELGAKYQEARIGLIEALSISSEKGALVHLNRVSHELDAFMEKVGTGDESADLELRLELAGKLRQLLPSLIKSEYSEVNTAVIQIVLDEILAEGPEKAVERADLFQKEFNKRADELTFYLYAILESYQESFGVNPENAGEGYSEKFYDFFDNAFLPAAQAYSSETGYSQFIHPDSYYQGVIDKLVAKQEELREKIGAYLVAAPLEIRRRDVLALMHGFETDRGSKGPQEMLTAFFTRKIFNEIAAQEKQISDEEAGERATYITAYGGVEGIGASSALIEYRGKGEDETDAIITDAGIKIDNQNTPPVWPEEFPVKPKAVFLTHAHLDHVGAAIELWEKLGRKVPFYVTPGTADILGRVLEFANNPSRESEGAVKGRDPAVVEEFMKSVKVLKPNRWYAVSPKMKVYFHGPVGHLHGAASLVISTPDGNTFLSGDVSINAQGPVPAFASLPAEIAANIDQALIESTYGMNKRTPESQQEGKLVNAVAERLSEGGRVLIPAFANGRSQRVLLLLLQNLEKIKGSASDFKIYIDGQAAVFTALYLKAYPEVFAPYRELIQKHVVLIQSDDYQLRGKMRSEVEERDGGQRTIIISSAGNASQGRSRYWATRLANDSKSGIFFTGYMDPQEMGSQLLSAAKEGREQFYFGSDVGLLPLKAKIDEFKLSGHASGFEIFEKVLEPMGESLRQLWIGHGGYQQSHEVLEWIRGKRPEWNPTILKKLERAQGSVPMTLPGLAARQEFFDSLEAEPLYPVVRPVQVEIQPAETNKVPLPAAVVEDHGAPLQQALIKREQDSGPVEDLSDKKTDVIQPARQAAEPALELTLEKERLSKDSRQALLTLRLKEVPELKASEAVVWMKEEVVRRGLPAAAGNFGESTLRADLKEIRARSELRDMNGKTTRSELRETVSAVLFELASPSGNPAPRALEAFLQAIEQFGFEAVAGSLQSEAFANPIYLVARGGEGNNDQETLIHIAEESAFQRKHPEAQRDLDLFVRALVRSLEADAARFFEASPDGRLNYSFAFPLAGSGQIREWFREYAETVQKIQSSYPGRVNADLRLLVTREEMTNEGDKDFFRALARTGVVKTVEVSSSQAAELQLVRFLEKNGNALVYGLEGFSLDQTHVGRLVKSAIGPENAFPVAVLLTRKLAEVQGKVSAELLGRVTHELPGMLVFNGTGLEITTLALELMYRFEANQLISSAA